MGRAVSSAVNGDEPVRNAEPPTTVIAQKDQVNGSLVIHGEGRILGGFEGQIECGSHLLIGKEAEVSATIRGVNITIAGNVRGNVLATTRLTITSTGRLDGDARVGALIVQEGGVHHGMTMVYPEGVPDEDGKPVAFQQPAQQQQPVAESKPEAPGHTVDRVKKLWGEFF
jgi:cytoskeletal protein CcmA (bactofilin family)